MIGGLRFYERQEIRDAAAYIRLLVRPGDDLAFERIVNLPKRGLGEAALRPIHLLAGAEEIPLSVAAETLVGTDELKPRQRSTLAGLMESFARWRAMLNEQPHQTVVETMLDESGYTAMWQKDNSPQAPGRLENLKELVAALEEFEDLPAFLDHVSLVMDREGSQNEPMVNIMTLHAAKGLEFDCVFLPGWEEGLFPHQLALDESGAAGLEEERRLAYVGLTRARKRAWILFAANRRIYNQWVSAIPSRFVDELPPDHVEVREAQGMPQASPSLYRGIESSPPPRFAAARGRGAGRMIDAESWSQVSDDGDGSAYAVGERVFHQKFGYGRVRVVEGNKLEIAFDKAGAKKVIDRFVKHA